MGLYKNRKSQFPGPRGAISGHRYYNPALGRFLGRDPAEEKGGLHLYGFVGNNSINKWDLLGNIPQYAIAQNNGFGDPDGFNEPGDDYFDQGDYGNTLSPSDPKPSITDNGNGT